MSDRVKILAIDDEPQILSFLKIALEGSGYDVSCASTGREGLDFIVKTKPELVVLDLGLPDMGGMDVLREIRKNNKTPVIILSVRDDEDSIVTALDLGADDYLCKPFALKELLARMKACLRRFERHPEDQLFLNGHLEADFEKRQIRVKGVEITLTATEFKILVLLAKNVGKVVTHKHLLHEIWGENFVSSTHYLRVYIGHLRQKIEGNPNVPEMIVTEMGVGYRMKVLSPDVRGA